MSTVNDLLKSSLRKLGVLASGETLSAEESKDALEALNSMIESWNNDNLVVLGVTIEEFSLIPGQQSYTIGAGGDFNTVVPIKTDAMFIKYDNNSELPIQMIDNNKWGNLQTKETQSTIPTHAYIDNNFPLQKIYLYPVPSEAKVIILHNQRKLSSFTNGADQILLPNGYKRAIIYNLAIELAPEYGKQTPGEVMKIAEDSLAKIKRSNIKAQEIGVDPFLTRRGAYDWRTGE